MHCTGSQVKKVFQEKKIINGANFFPFIFMCLLIYMQMILHIFLKSNYLCTHNNFRNPNIHYDQNRCNIFYINMGSFLDQKIFYYNTSQNFSDQFVKKYCVRRKKNLNQVSIKYAINTLSIPILNRYGGYCLIFKQNLTCYLVFHILKIHMQCPVLHKIEKNLLITI